MKPSLAPMGPRCWTLTFLAASMALGQINGPGSYPGSYPPGQYPGGGGAGIPMPGRHKKKKEAQQDLKQFTGRIIELGADHITIDATDHREITCSLTSQTKFLDGEERVKLENLSVNQKVMIESTEDDQGNFAAVNVHVTSKVPGTIVSQTPTDASRDADDSGPPKMHRGESADKAETAAETPAEKPSTIVSDAPSTDSDDDRPVLRRGKPQQTASARTAPARETEPDADSEASPESKPDAANDHMDEFLEKARQTTEEFTAGLPNYTCMEMVTRYSTETIHGVAWKPIDVISTKLIFDHGRESYQDTTVNGHKADPKKSGSWSYGEFGAMLAGLFNPATGARFTFSHGSRISGFTANMFDFEVERPRSNYTIQEGGQTIHPAYKGSVWIDTATHRVIRIEMQAVDIPKGFPLDRSEIALDYQYVLLGAHKFLVPVHADMLGCFRGTPQCDKNAMDFRNYRKFGSESDVTFEQ